MTDKVLLVGIAPGHGDPLKPLEGRIGRRLAELWGVSEATYLDGTVRVNLLPRDHDGGRVEAYRQASRIEAQYFTRGQHVILLGRQVAAAFWYPAEWWFVPKPSRSGVWVSLLPHPSGLNRWWNDRRHVRLVGRTLRQHFPLARLPQGL